MVKRKSRPQTWLQGPKGGMRSVPGSGATKVVAGKNQQVVGSSPSAGSNIAAVLCTVFGEQGAFKERFKVSLNFSLKACFFAGSGQSRQLTGA